MQNEEFVNETALPKLDIHISPDKMNAYLRVSSIDKDATLEPEMIIGQIEEMGITHGIQVITIEDFCVKGMYYKELKVASGVRSIRGSDGFATFHFRTEISKLPKEKDDGSIDFKDLGLIQNVEKDQVLCTITPPTAGTPGINIFGEEVEAQSGVMPDVKAGKNTCFSEDGLSIYATLQGNVQLARDTIEVEDVYYVKGDVDSSIGDINFSGTVMVKGNILEGFQVTAQKDIIVKGRVEGTELNAGGNIVIDEGINGMKKGRVHAAGNVSCKFIETGTVICGGDFCCDVCLNSDIKAGKSIILKGRKSALVGGSYVAGETITARTIGTEMNIPVNVTIDPQWYERDILGKEKLDGRPQSNMSSLEMQEKIEELEGIVIHIKKEIEELSKFDNVSDTMAQKAVTIKKLLLKKAEAIGNISRLKESLTEMEAYQKNHEYKIVCKGSVHHGVKIVIENAFLKVSNTIDNKHFYQLNGEVVMGAVLPHEV